MDPTLKTVRAASVSAVVQGAHGGAERSLRHIGEGRHEGRELVNPSRCRTNCFCACLNDRITPRSPTACT